MIATALIITNIILALTSTWAACDAWTDSSTLHEISSINASTEAIWYLIPIIVAGLSALIKPARLTAGICSAVILLTGAFVVYDTWSDTSGNTYNCLAEAGIDIEKQTECVNKALSTKSSQHT